MTPEHALRRHHLQERIGAQYDQLIALAKRGGVVRAVALRELAAVPAEVCPRGPAAQGTHLVVATNRNWCERSVVDAIGARHLGSAHTCLRTPELELKVTDNLGMGVGVSHV